MNPDPPKSALRAEKWIQRAENDLAAAKCLKHASGNFSWQACFQAQQAAEKAIKALLLFRELEFPKTHNLFFLLEFCQKNKIHMTKDILRVGNLTPFAVQFRYPGEEEDITGEEVEEAIALAQNAVAWVKKIFAGKSNS